MAMYGGIDLHSNNSYVAVVDEDLRTVVSQRVPNDPEVILATLRPLREELAGVVWNRRSTGTGWSMA